MDGIRHARAEIERRHQGIRDDIAYWETRNNRQFVDVEEIATELNRLYQLEREYYDVLRRLA